MKKVGIILRDYISKNDNQLYGLRNDLIKYLAKYNIEIICIPVIFDNDDDFMEFKRVEELIKECRGIIIPGGEKLYDIDLKIANYLHKENIPTLGICLGMQIMSVALNGDIDTLKTNNHQSKEKYVHKIKIKPNSKLYSIIKENEILVNSRHNDYITCTDLKITAIAEDNIIEAVEDPNKEFFIGVQWHPESIENDIYSERLFTSFINCL